MTKEPRGQSVQYGPYRTAPSERYGSVLTVSRERRPVCCWPSASQCGKPPGLAATHPMVGTTAKGGKVGRASSVCGGRLAIWCHMARRAGGCRTTVPVYLYLGRVLFVVITSSVRGKGHHYQYCICTEYGVQYMSQQILPSVPS
jgi:hypothetical protein